MATMLSFHPTMEKAPVVARTRRAPALILPIGEGRLHAKLYHRLRELIESGSWSAGMRIPSSRALAEDLGVSRNTASIALEHLVAEGWAEARSRSGIYVSRRLPHAPTPCMRAVRAVELQLVRQLSDAPTDLFPLRHWRSIQARLWAAHGHDLLESPSAGGEPGLRESLARLVCTARGLDVDANDIVIASDVGAAIGAIAAALGGDAALVSDPECPAVLDGLSQHDVPTQIWTGPDNAEAGSTIVSAALHIPTGASLGGPARRDLLQWAATGNRWIIERDCSGWAASARGTPISPLAADPAPGRVIYVRGFDDILFPGLPLCFVAAPREIVELVRSALARQAPPSRADQMSFQAFVEEGYLAAHLRRLRRALPERRERLRRLLVRVAGAHVRIGAAMLPRHLMLETKTDAPDRIAALLRQAGLPVHMLRQDDGPASLLAGFSGLTDAVEPAIEARLQQLFAVN